MPLIQSGDKQAVGENIKRESESGRPHRQAVAIALAVQRKNGGRPGAPRPAAKPGVRK